MIIPGAALFRDAPGLCKFTKENMKTRILLSLIAGCLVFAAIGCGDGTSKDDGSSQTQQGAKLPPGVAGDPNATGGGKAEVPDK